MDYFLYLCRKIEENEKNHLINHSLAMHHYYNDGTDIENGPFQGN